MYVYVCTYTLHICTNIKCYALLFVVVYTICMDVCMYNSLLHKIFYRL